MRQSPSTVKEPAARYVDAEFLGRKYSVTGRYILLLAAQNKIPCLRLGRRCVRFDVQEVANALEEGITV